MKIVVPSGGRIDDVAQRRREQAAGLVLDQHRQSGVFLQALAHQAGDRVRSTAGDGRNDDAHGLAARLRERG